MAHSFTAFYPNCTLPPHSVSYVAAPGVRSTLDILWTSLATIIACTYSVLHLNVPEQREGRDPGWKGDLKWSLRRLRKSVKYTSIAVLAPEYILAYAIHNYLHARIELKMLHRSVPATRDSWSLTHMLFADMGGFVLRYTAKDSQADNGIVQHADQSQHALDPASDHSTQCIIPHSTEALERNNKLNVSKGLSIWHLTCGSLRGVIENGHLSPEIVPAEEILDKSKSDMFTKILIIVQVSYFVVAVVARAIKRLPITQLELGVCAFVACSAFTYGFTLSKPKSVTTAIAVHDYGAGSLPPSLLEMLRKTQHYQRRPGAAPSNEETSPHEYKIAWRMVVSTAIVFGGIHLAGWNFHFPSAADAWLWRSASIISIVVPAISFLADVITHDLDEIMAGFVLLYSLVRLILIVEMFRCMAYLTPQDFMTTWTTNIPHIG